MSFRKQTSPRPASRADKVLRTTGFVAGLCVTLLLMLGPFSVKSSLECLALCLLCVYGLRRTWS